MIILFIDTSLVNVSISILKDCKEIALVQKDIPNMHSIYVTKFIQDVMIESKIEAQDIDKIMVVNGPGSFTGLRIGVTIAKTFGYLINKNITLVSSLKSLAISSQYDGIIMSIIPANKSNYYVGIYNNNYDSIYNEEFMNIEKVKELIDEYHPYIVGINDMMINEYKINKTLLDVSKISKYYYDKEEVNPHKAVPNYLKLPQALEEKK